MGCFSFAESGNCNNLFTAENKSTSAKYAKIGDDGYFTLGHAYNSEPAWTWNLYNTVCDISLACDDGDYTISSTDETPVVNVEITTVPGAVDGKYDLIATASIDGKVKKYTTSKNVTDIAAVSVTGANTSVYTGEAITPEISVMDGDTPLVVGTDYELNYSDNTEVGTATITITGIGDYIGTSVTEFSIFNYYPEIPATYEADGNIEYYTDADGNYYIKDGDTYTLVSAEDIRLEKLTMSPSMNVSADSSKMNMNVYVPVAEGCELSDYTVTFGGEEQSLTEQTIEGQSYGLFSVICAAKEMTDEKEIVISNGETELYRHTTSVASYLNSILGNDAYSGYHDVVRSMLRYGAAAQTYFDYNANDLANASVEGAAISTLTDIPDNSPTAEQFNEAFGLEYSDYSAMNMTFNADTTLLIAFKPKNGADAEQIKTELEEKFVNGEYEVTVDPDNSGKFYIVQVKNIPVKKLGDAVFTFGEVEGKATDYLGRIANNTAKSENLRNLCKSLYNYYVEAKQMAQ